MRVFALAPVAASILAVLVVLPLGASLSACRGDPVRCDQGCRNFATLVYWKNADAQIAAEPEATRDALRKRLVGEFAQRLESGIDTCVSQCQSANNTVMVDCMIEAKTADQALACFKSTRGSSGQR
jgi:hypothetical protein